MGDLSDIDCDLAVLDFWPDGDVNEAYYQCWYPNTLIMGPYGSGKSKTTAAKLLDAICLMPVSKRGSRQSSAIISRNYEADLLTATLGDWKSIIPGGDLESLGKFTQSSPSIHALDFDGTDGIPIECEVQFLPLDNIKEAHKKLKGQEYTFGWWNEAAESKEEIINVWRGRIGGRYPAHNDMPAIPVNAIGDRFWSGAFYDTNPPDDEHWVHQVIETPTPAQQRNWRCFVQPPGATKNLNTGEWEPNPLAENLINLSPSYYHQKVADALSEDWVRINIGNEYGATLDGVPVWSNYSQVAHETDTVDYDSSLPVFGGLDYGRTPAMSLWQKLGDTHLMFDEFTSKDMSAELFGPACRQFLWDRWKIRAADVDVCDDPAGGSKSQATEDTPRQIMRASGFSKIRPAPCEENNITVRRKAMLEPLGRMSMAGRACVLIHKRCKTFRKGAASKFYYRKLQVSYDDMFSDKPIKNFYSHICESGEYYMVGQGEGTAWLSADIKPQSKRQRRAMVAHNNHR